jgi:signal transduction histidine kinase
MVHFPVRPTRTRGTDTDFRTEPSSTQMLVIVAVGFGVIVFLVIEFMHYLLVPDLGRHGERMVAEGVSALIVGCLAAMLFRSAREHRQATRARLQVIAEMNHHIRNALTPISLSAYVVQDQQSIRVISEGVERIEWALREILPRQRPLTEQERNRLFYFEWRKGHNNMPSASETSSVLQASERTNQKVCKPPNPQPIEATHAEQGASFEVRKSATTSTRGSAATFGEQT